ncbi:MAG: ATPase [Thermoplasmatales archaeon B_DKE]|nr:MAG: ATPase [Thermoplasmatales archaeon B_DKE]QRF75568.1 putative KH and PIN-domain containing protein [Thermoplasmatales archaeon]
MDYVPDTSVIVDGRFTAFISSREGSHVILAEAMLAEVEHQANDGRSIGFAGLEELKSLRSMAEEGRIYLDLYGKRPGDWQIKSAKSGEIDEIIRNTALENDAILVTGDIIQRDLAIIKGIQIEFLEASLKSVKNIEDFFDEMTSSVHLKANLKPVLKKGIPGAVRVVRLDYVITRQELETIASIIVKRGKFEDESFVEMDMFGATVIQLKNIRIVITRPPFSDDLEITAVRPIKKLDLVDYNLDPRVVERLTVGSNGILVAGPPGAGKSTFVQALAEYFNSMDKTVKTMEKPRDLQLINDITQYTGLEGSMEKTGDILLLVRTDYTVFDEMRVTSDFHVYSDLRLAGVGMIGVVHATRPIDAFHRFIGRIELGLIPQVIDTILFIEAGQVRKVIITEYTVKVPSGMNQEDLARPVIVVKDFPSGTPLYEIYTFGDQIVLVPVQTEDSSLFSLASDRIREEVSKFLGTGDVEVKMTGGNRAVVSVPEKFIAKLIGKKGVNISDLEGRLKVRLEVEPRAGASGSVRKPVEIEVKNKILYLYVGDKNTNVKIFVEDLMVLQARSSSKGIIRLKLDSDLGSSIYGQIKNGKRIEFSPEE